jgi:hypothetical protein
VPSTLSAQGKLTGDEWGPTANDPPKEERERGPVVSGASRLASPIGHTGEIPCGVNRTPPLGRNSIDTLFQGPLKGPDSLDDPFSPHGGLACRNARSSSGLGASKIAFGSDPHCFPTVLSGVIAELISGVRPCNNRATWSISD